MKKTIEVDEADLKILKRTKERLHDRMVQTVFKGYKNKPTEKDIFINDLIEYIEDLETIIFGLWIDRIGKLK